MKKIPLLILVGLFVVACGSDGGGDGDGNGDDSSNNETLNVINIVPIYFGEHISQADLIQGDCADVGEPPDPEPFDHHYADVTLINRVPAGVDPKTASSIEVTSYEIEHPPCPYSVSSPPTGKISIPGSKTISPCGATVFSGDCPNVTITVFLLTMEQKDAVKYVGGLIPCEADYIFYGVTTYGRQVAGERSADFIAANYDYCGTELP